MYTKNTLPKISWSKIKLFLQCQRCFYRDLVLKIKRPDGEQEKFALGNVVDKLWKNKMNIYRKKQITHPLFASKTNNAVPFIHESLKEWQDYKNGIRLIDKTNNLELCGVIDDILINSNNELIIIDYKATDNPCYVFKSSQAPINRKQVSFYAFLLKENGYTVSKDAFIVYNVALDDNVNFNQEIKLETSILPYPIDYFWIDRTLQDIRKCLDENYEPVACRNCKFCNYELSKKYVACNKLLLH